MSDGPALPVSVDGHLLPELVGERSRELPGDVSGRTALLPAILGFKGSVLGWDLAFLVQAPTVHLLRVELPPSQVGRYVWVRIPSALGWGLI